MASRNVSHFCWLKKTPTSQQEESKVIILWEELAKRGGFLQEKQKNFKEKTNLRLRKLAGITRINKDKINKMTK